MQALGIESLRERTPMTPFPAPNRLHVWWARRPLVASRAAILGALLPADADREKFMHMLGIHGDPVAAKLRIAQATKEGLRLGKEAYGYPRAFSYTPSPDAFPWNSAEDRPVVVDPTAGGGSIPFEAVRVGCATVGNDLNPVAWLILKATVEFPAKFGGRVLLRYEELGEDFRKRCVEQLSHFYPHEPEENWIPDGYLWARTITCPYCDGAVPLSPNWKLNNKGVGVRLVPVTDDPKDRHIRFEIVQKTEHQSASTVSGGKGSCPFPDCGRVIDGDEIKAQAQSSKMGEQLYTVVYKEEKVTGHTKTGKKKVKKVRGFRAPRPEDDVREDVAKALEMKLPEWQARGMVPDEDVLPGNKTTEPMRYGMNNWRDMFSPRQLYGHCVSVDVFHELVEECGGAEKISELDKAALCYLTLAIDKLLNYNARMVRWHANREVLAGVFDRHDFSFKWSYAEMAPTITGLGYDWAIKQTGKSLKELVELIDPNSGQETEGLFPTSTPAITIYNDSGDNLTTVEDASVDAVIMDPPYGANVMYAELADFFYVWLKRTAGLLFPEQFMSYLTDKDREAVANVAKFKDFTKVKGTGGAQKRATRDYQERMQAIFTECRRVLKSEGIMVVMFTHKGTGTWDALAKGLVDAGFAITASWPVNTEAEGSMHIKDKNAAKSTIFLVCRPRRDPADEAETTYWEDVEPKVAAIVKERVRTFQEAGIRGVDLYLSCFGPALEVFSEHWPMQRGRALQKPEEAKGAQLKLQEDEEWDPYAVRPEDALMAARGAVKEWRLAQLTTVKRHASLDPVTEFFVLAWDAFQSPQFPADEALKLSRVVGLSFDQQLRGKILEVKSSDVILWDSITRAQKGSVGRFGGPCLLDTLHQVSRTGREQNIGIARDNLEQANLLDNEAFKLAVEAVLNVLPAPRLAESGANVLAGAAADCGALEKLRQLCYSTEIPQPIQLELGPA